MSGFSADWLTLREKADVAARSEVVLEAARAYCANVAEKPFRICDLGSGTGASVAAFSSQFPAAQTWDLIDYDAENLQRAVERYTGSGAIEDVTVTPRVHNLALNPAPWQPNTDIVTATALFDLASPEWLVAFANRLAANRLPILTTLTYDGRHVLAPELPLDATMAEAFNTHQRSDKGFGVAAGPDATNQITGQLQDHDYSLVIGDSSWHLNAQDDSPMIAALLDGWSQAVIDRDLVPEHQVREWHSARIKNTATLQVGHLDFFAAPNPRNQV